MIRYLSLLVILLMSVHALADEQLIRQTVENKFGPLADQHVA